MRLGARINVVLNWFEEPTALRSQETCFLLGECAGYVNALARMPLRRAHRESLLTVSLIRGAQATTAIEGNTLSDEEIRKIAEKQESSVPPSREYQAIEVSNILGAMNALLEEVAGSGLAQKIDPSLLKRLHSWVGARLGEHFEAIPGQFRTNERVVGTYRCPAAQDVPELVDRLCAWLQEEFDSARGNQTIVDAVIQAIVTHVYIEGIHPFGDGNGRTGRLVEFYILLRAGYPDLASHILSNFYNQTRPVYYRKLAEAKQNRDLTCFLEMLSKVCEMVLQRVSRPYKKASSRPRGSAMCTTNSTTYRCERNRCSSAGAS